MKSWSRFTAFQSAPNVKSYPNLPEHIIYFRLVLGLLCGLYFAFREYQQVYNPNTTYIMSGFVGIVASLNFVMFIPVMFVNFYLNADLDSFKGRLNFTGLINGVSLAILIWILAFTWVHDKEEMILNQALIQVASVVGSGETIHPGNLDVPNVIESTLNAHEEF